MKALFQLFVVFYWEWISLLIWRTPLVFFSSESTSHFGCFIIESKDTWKFKRSSKWVAYSSFNNCIGVQLLELVAIALISPFRVCEKCFKRWLFLFFLILIRNLFTWYWFKLYHWAAFWMYILKKGKEKSYWWICCYNWTFIVAINTTMVDLYFLFVFAMLIRM